MKAVSDTFSNSRGSTCFHLFSRSASRLYFETVSGVKFRVRKNKTAGTAFHVTNYPKPWTILAIKPTGRELFHILVKSSCRPKLQEMVVPNSYSSKVYSFSGLSPELRENDCRPSTENSSQMISNLYSISLLGCWAFHRLSLHFSHFSYFLEIPSEITSALPSHQTFFSGDGGVLSLMNCPTS